MASHLRRKCADHRPSSFATTPRRFLKVIADDTSRDRKLGIPKSFLDKYGEDLSNWVYFKLPCGLKLKIGITSYNGEVWFRKGWPDFSKLFSLEKGYSLLFGYDGDSRFHVSIFDGSNNMEIDYTARRMLKSEETDQDDDISLDIPVDIRPTALPHKQNRTFFSTKAEIKVDSEERVKKERHWSKSEMERKDQFEAERDGGDKETRWLQRAKSYNRSFKVPMHQTYINQNLVWLPKPFAKKYLVTQPQNATLKVSGEKKTWPVKLIYIGQSGRVKFQSGWTDFVRDISLKEGDICEFVLVDSKRLMLDVKITTADHTLSPDIEDDNDENDEQEDEDDCDDESIEILDHFPPHLKRKEKSPLESHLRKRKRHSSTPQVFPERRPEVPRKMHPPVTASSRKDIALQRANDFEPANPGFKILLQPSYICGKYLNVPAKFAERYLVEQPSHAILQVERKGTWSVNFHYTAKRITFQSGWSAFAQDNGLKEGDACVFMLTDKIKFLFDVVFFRST